MYDSNITKVRIEKVDLDLCRAESIMYGKGIRLSSVKSFDKKNEKVYDGLQSEFFGTDFGDDRAYTERYSCKCKKYIGMMYKGDICDVCHTEVDFHDNDLTKAGWIILDHYKVISPIFIAKLHDALGVSDGEKVLDKILDVSHDTGMKKSEKELAELKKHPFIGKGMIWFRENILEVLEFYQKKPNKEKLFKELIESIPIMFTSSIYVYSSVLRTEVPGVKGSKVFKLKINTHFQSIIRLVNYVNRLSNDVENDDDEDDTGEYTQISINKKLAAIIKELFDVFNETYKAITSKKGIIVTKVLGGRNNFSARNILIQQTQPLRADEIEIGYLTFMELFRYEIINIYHKIYKCSIMEASHVWKKGLTNPSKILYDIMNHMCNDKDSKKYMYVLVSRNPCINYGSHMCMRIARVKENLHDKTMTIPSCCLTTFNADFDGDIMNIIRIFGHDMIKLFSRNLNPRYNLYISKLNGRVNNNMLPFKDEVVGFYAFNTI